MPLRSPLTVDAARRVLDYDRAVFGRFERRIRRLPAGDAFADRGTGHGSFFGTLLHILHVRDAWVNFAILGRGAGEEAFFGRPERTPTDWRGLARFAATVWEGQARLRAELTAERLAGRTSVFWMPGRYSVGDAILQISYEEAHHLGEIIGALWVLDRPSPEMTWIGVGRDALGTLRAPRRRRRPS